MASLGSLVIELAANTAKLSGDLGRAVSMAEGATKKMSAAAGLASKAFAGIGGALAGFALGDAIKSAIEFGDSINKAAIKAGVGGQAMSELAYAAKLADVDIAALSTGLKKMQVELSTAQANGIKAGSALEALGLTMKDLGGLSADAQFELIGDRISKLQNPADRTRAAVELFGKAGSDLLPLFEQGAEGIKKAREEAQRLGISLTGDAITKLADADDAIKRLESSWKSFATTLVAKVAPGLTDVLNNLTAIATGDRIGKLREQIDFLERMKGRSFVAAGYGDIGTGFFTATSGAAKLEELQRRLRLLGPASAHDIGNHLDSPKGFADAGGAKAALEAARKYSDQLDQLTGVTVNLRNTNLDLWTSTQTDIEKTSASIEAQIAALQVLGVAGVGSLEEYKKRMDDILAPLQEIEPTVKKKAIPAFSELSDFAKQAASNMQDSMSQFFFDPFKGGLRGLLSSFINTIRQMVAQVLAEKTLLAIFGGGKNGTAAGGISSLLGGIGKLFGFADGGSFHVGGSGGTDSQLVAFKASPNETVSVTKPGQGNGGGTTVVYSPVTHVSGLGMTPEQLLPVLVARDRAMIERLQQSFSRSNMRAPTFV